MCKLAYASHRMCVSVNHRGHISKIFQRGSMPPDHPRRLGALACVHPLTSNPGSAPVSGGESLSIYTSDRHTHTHNIIDKHVDAHTFPAHTIHRNTSILYNSMYTHNIIHKHSTAFTVLYTVQQKVNNEKLTEGI